MLYTDQNIKKRRSREIKLKKITSTILYIILVPIMIYNISLIIQSVVNTNETPSFFGIKTYVIISGSMEPNINIGDIVITKKIKDESELKAGDVISFRKGESVITHRIVRIDEEQGQVRITTKGDNNNAEDSERIFISNIEGKEVSIIHNLGNVSLVLQNKTIIIIILIFFYIYLSRNYKISQRRSKRRIKRIEHEMKKNSKS